MILRDVLRGLRLRPLVSILLITPGLMSGSARAQLVGDAAAPEPLGDAWQLRVDPQLREHPLHDGEQAATAAIATHATGTAETDLALSGNAELRRYAAVIKGDFVHYDLDRDMADAYGHVSITRDGNTFSGPDAHLRVEATHGFMSAPKYHFVTNGGWGSGRRVDLIDNERSSIRDGTYTTCQCVQRPAWYLTASRFDIDSGSNTGTAYGGVLFFLGLPVFASPFLSFPLSNERRSGLLPPTFSFSTTGGIDLALPWYFNIAPNYDLTVTPRLIERRGEMLSADYRYLGTDQSGELTFSLLPNDAITKTDRYSISLKHDWRIDSHLSAYVNYNRVSDASVTTDLASGNAFLTGSTTLYDQEAGLHYDNGPWSVLLREQHWQSYSGSSTYNREPQLNVKYARYNVGGLDFGAEADATRFSLTSSDTTNGSRFVFNPYVAFPVVRPAWYIVPKLQWHFASYDLSSIGSDAPAGQPKNFNVNVPTFSLDSGVTFERSVHLFGHAFIQTLEPRLFYVYTPYRDQRFAPLFDTAEADWGLAELFTTNGFVGNDRVSDENRVTAALTSRFIDAATGSKAARFVLAQRYDFRNPRVTLLANDTTLDLVRTGLIAGASYRPGPDLAIEQAVEYGETKSYLTHASAGVGWSPGVREVLNVAYRYTRPNTTLDNEPGSQVIVSGQWPFGRRLSSIARVNYDMRVHRLIAGLVGFQYDADCWSLGLAFEKYTNETSSTTEPDTGSRVLLQLQLNGLSKIDNGLLNQFRENVPGYTPLPSDSESTSRFSDYP